MCIAHARQLRVNIVIEGTMRNSDAVASTAADFRAADYRVDARALAVNFKLSEQGILLRYERQKQTRGSGRMTTEAAHRAAYDGMVAALDRLEREKLVDQVTLYQRGAEILYVNTLDHGEWRYPAGAAQALTAERARPMTLQEHQDYVAVFDRLVEMQGRPDRAATDGERSHVLALRASAQAGLVAEIRAQVASTLTQLPDLQQRVLLLRHDVRLAREMNNPSAVVDAHHQAVEHEMERLWRQRVDAAHDKLVTFRSTVLEPHLDSAPRVFGRERWLLDLNVHRNQDVSNLQTWERLKQGRIGMTRQETEVDTLQASHNLQLDHPELVKALQEAKTQLLAARPEQLAQHDPQLLLRQVALDLRHAQLAAKFETLGLPCVTFAAQRVALGDERGKFVGGDRGAGSGHA
uniref:zeta toxin family protein n=1 Tax=Burkholderia arboris TaxID=488730 RepID=UPI003BEEF962